MDTLSSWPGHTHCSCWFTLIDLCWWWVGVHPFQFFSNDQNIPSGPSSYLMFLSWARVLAPSQLGCCSSLARSLWAHHRTGYHGQECENRFPKQLSNPNPDKCGVWICGELGVFCFLFCAQIFKNRQQGRAIAVRRVIGMAAPPLETTL